MLSAEEDFQPLRRELEKGRMRRDSLNTTAKYFSALLFGAISRRMGEAGGPSRWSITGYDSFAAMPREDFSRSDALRAVIRRRCGG